MYPTGLPVQRSRPSLTDQAFCSGIALSAGRYSQSSRFLPLKSLIGLPVVRGSLPEAGWAEGELWMSMTTTLSPAMKREIILSFPYYKEVTLCDDHNCLIQLITSDRLDTRTAHLRVRYRTELPAE